MVTTRILLPLTLACLTLQPIHSLERFNALKSAGLGTAFGLILPTALGIGSHFLEKKVGIEHRGSWREDEFNKIESNKLLQTVAVSLVSTITWAVLKGLCANDTRLAWSMMAVYCYGQGRAYYMHRQSSLQKTTSMMLPAALGLLAYTRIPDLAPQLDLAGKSLLVFGLVPMCGI